MSSWQHLRRHRSKYPLKYECIFIVIHGHLSHGKQFHFSLIVLCDFQVGLAVGDIDKIQVNALIDRYVMQVEQPALQ